MCKEHSGVRTAGEQSLLKIFSSLKRMIHGDASDVIDDAGKSELQEVGFGAAQVAQPQAKGTDKAANRL